MCNPTSMLIVLLCFFRESFYLRGKQVGYDFHLHERCVACNRCHCCFNRYSGNCMSDEKKNQ